MVRSRRSGASVTEPLPYPLISPFKGKGEIAAVLASLHTEHRRLHRSARILIQEFEGPSDALPSGLPLRLEFSGDELIWRTTHSLDRNRPFALFSAVAEPIRSQLHPQALDWLVYIEHRRLLHKARLISVVHSMDALRSGLVSCRALEQRLCELGNADHAISESDVPDDIRAFTEDHADAQPLSENARRRRRNRKPASIFAGRASALRNLDDLSREQRRIIRALDELREDWRPRVPASGIALFPGDGALPVLRWRVTNATLHGKRRRVDLTEPASLAILRRLASRVAVRAIATEAIRIDWSTRASAVHGARLAHVEYRKALDELDKQIPERLRIAAVP